jgi:hypothetical protein
MLPHRREMARNATAETPMSDVTPHADAAKHKTRTIDADIVTANGLATHLGMTRQNVARLTAEAIIEQRSDGCYDETASRLKYIRHLREQQRRSPRVEADAALAKAKTEMLLLRLMEKRRELMKVDEVFEMIDGMVGVMLTAMSSMPARCAPRGDLATRRGIEKVVFEVRTEIANIAQQKADAYGEPPLSEQD